ncbi:MAG TPA: carboxypeptidase-like regulatory domain-containing protein, partial [Verrucomicrobiae bacterium]|nr:carboxypeptidase-like regulatory domain-containing protein [Verrucomicrobiae bacterium]
QGPGNVPGQAENVDFQTCPVTSRDDGSWTCSYIPKDWTNEIRLVLRKEGYATTFPTVPVAKVDLNSLVLVLNRGFTVTGRVVDTRDQAVADAHIKILTSETGKRQSVDTDENGIFTLTGVAGDSAFSREPRLETNDSGTVFIRGLIGEGSLHVNLAVQADGFAPRTDTVELSKATNAAEFVLSPGHVFRGRVVDESGKPISNAVVQTDWDNQGLRAFDWKTRTDAAGRFEWDSAPGGPTLFWFEAAGYRWNRGVSLSADGSDHRVVLNRPTTP